MKVKTNTGSRHFRDSITPNILAPKDVDWAKIALGWLDLVPHCTVTV
jgi:hypothetical protein